jgi:alpha-1,3-rhamnosyl/mannosyltransferase
VRQKFALPQNHVLFVGASQPRKNLATLLQAWEIAASQLHDTALVVVGRINPSRIPSASDGSPGKVRFIGYVEDSDLAALYSGAKLFVYPSLYEGFGLPVLEAMTCGAPAITSRRASLPEVAGGEAFYVDPENIGEMADAILELLSDEDRRQSLIQSGFAQARKFSWQAAAEAHWDLFVSLLENDG